MVVWPYLSTLGVDATLGLTFLSIYFLRPAIKTKLDQIRDNNDKGKRIVIRDVFTAKVPWRRPQQPPLKSLLAWALIAMWFVISGSLRPIVDISLSLISIVVPISISMQRYSC